MPSDFRMIMWVAEEGKVSCREIPTYVGPFINTSCEMPLKIQGLDLLAELLKDNDYLEFP